MIFDKFKRIIVTVIFLSLTNAVTNSSNAATIATFPILDDLKSQGKPLAKETKKWMKAWRGTNLDNPEFKFPGLSGASSIHLQIQQLDPTSKKGYNGYGFFMSHNSSGNPDTEIAYFNLAAILGHDDIFRPAIAYTLGSKTMLKFKSLLASTPITGAIRLKNKATILKAIATNRPLKGCLKAEKSNTYTDYAAIANTNASLMGAPQTSNLIIRALQANNPQPVAGQIIKLKKGYKGDVAQLAREYSIIMTLDAVFQQWDRYTGGNVALLTDKAGDAHFYATDNGGAALLTSPVLVTRNLNWFSRYDRQTITQLKALYAFLINPAKGYLGYKNAQLFVAHLGLYSELPPATYVSLLRRNLQLLLAHVATVERKFGSKAAYLP
jgi:hypothetical protein